MKRVMTALVWICLAFPASAEQLVREILPTPPQGGKLEARLSTATIEPGAIGHWHSYPNHNVVYVAEGSVTVEFRDGGSKTFSAGEGFVEPIDTVLRGANKGDTPVKLVIFQVSPPDVPDAVDAR